MARSRHPACLIVSSDYLDLDVALNVRAFYGCAGYRILPSERRSGEADLLVVLRGDNGRSHRDFRGEVHIYDYVKEYKVDWLERFPRAASVVLISLSTPSSTVQDPSLSHQDPHPSQPSLPNPLAPAPSSRLRWIDAYLPVIPALWQRPWSRKQQRALHLSNYKRMPGDAFQQDLLEQIQAGVVQVFGANWQRLGVSTHPLSYWQANRRLARCARCFGLMWPYQRGLTLSGRMWQAPLQGCFVLSEAGTNRLAVPGVLELPSFAPAALPPPPDLDACRQLSQEAATFWEDHTRQLAASLGFDPQLILAGGPLRRQRWSLRAHHLLFLQKRLRHRLQQGLGPPAGRLRRGLSRGLRRLGLLPRRSV
jgi:hypothetical protein